MKNTQSNVSSIDYPKLLSDLRAILAMEKIWGERALNHIKVQIIWEIGERISQEFQEQTEKNKYGNALYLDLAKDLKISKSHLFAAVQFFVCYQLPQYISPELSWSHYKLLITIKNAQLRRFYEQQAITHTWSIRDLKHKIQSEEHKKLETSQVSMPSSYTNIPEITEVIKNSYDFNFIQLPETYSEKDLEKSLINQIGKFILELGSGFFSEGINIKSPFQVTQIT